MNAHSLRVSATRPLQPLITVASQGTPNEAVTIAEPEINSQRIAGEMDVASTAEVADSGNAAPNTIETVLLIVGPGHENFCRTAPDDPSTLDRVRKMASEAELPLIEVGNGVTDVTATALSRLKGTLPENTIAIVYTHGWMEEGQHVVQLQSNKSFPTTCIMRLLRGLGVKQVSVRACESGNSAKSIVNTPALWKHEGALYQVGSSETSASGQNEADILAEFAFLCHCKREGTLPDAMKVIQHNLQSPQCGRLITKNEETDQAPEIFHFSAPKGIDDDSASKRIKVANSEPGEQTAGHALPSHYAGIKREALNFEQQQDLTQRILCQRVYKGDIDAVKNLLQENPDVQLDWKLPDGTTALFMAVEKGHIDIARLLLGHNADVNATHRGGSNPLHLAVQGNSHQMIELLLQSGCDVNATNALGETALFAAAGKGDLKTVELLLKYRADTNIAKHTGSTPLFIAAQNNHPQIAAMLLGDDAKVDAATKGGATPLFIAAHNGHANMVQLLLENRARSDQACNNGETPYDAAAAGGHAKVINLLLSSLASPIKVASI